MTDNSQRDLPADVQEKLTELAERHTRAARGGIAVINALGTRAEDLTTRLPAPVRAGLDTATRAALAQAARLAHASRGPFGTQPAWIEQSIGAALGAAGGLGGAPTALAELPVTVTLLMRIIQSEAMAQGFDPSDESVRFDCLTVFGSAGPLADDDGANTAFLSARLTLTGAGVQRIVQTIAPRLATALGQKLAAQSVPILGAAAGAAINYTYTSYYREMAHIHFALRRMAIEADIPERVLVSAFRRNLLGPASG